jgi:hypothetical protein
MFNNDNWMKADGNDTSYLFQQDTIGDPGTAVPDDKR